MEPPNPDATTIGAVLVCGNLCGAIDTPLHRRQRPFM